MNTTINHKLSSQKLTGERAKHIRKHLGFKKISNKARREYLKKFEKFELG